MPALIRLSSVLLLLAACSRAPDAAPAAAAVASITYPATRRGDTVDVYHGVEVRDPYRWLEDPDSEETRAWVEAQNAITFDFLAKIPERPRIQARLTELWDYEKYGVPFKKADRYFFTRNDGLQNQSVLYTTTSLDAEPIVLLDPNTLSDDGTVALAGTWVSLDGTLMVYALAAAGSDWKEWRVREVETGKDRPDVLKWIKWSDAAWTPDGKGFFYSRYPAPNEGAELEETNFNNKLYYHRLGTRQAEDVLVAFDPEQEKWGYTPQVSEDGHYLVINVSKGTDDRNRLLFKRLAAKNDEITTLIDDFESAFIFLGNDGPVFYLRTTDSAPRGRIIALDTRKPAPVEWRELIPQADSTIESAGMVGDRFFVRYLEDAKSAVRVFDLNGKPIGNVGLPGIGSAWGFDGERAHDETFYAFASFTRPPTIYRYDLGTNTSRVFRRPEVAFDPDAFETKQVFATSKDGTRVPIFITHEKGLLLDGANPTILYGYGGFNISITPWFSVTWEAWAQMGGVVAVANLRGGGEYGEEWHDAGRLLNKQNVFDDFAAAAEWLIENGYTSRKKLGITGNSNGGLLVGASITQRPELFGAAVAGVGVHDMLRFHEFTIGWAWIDDYGSSTDPEQFEALYAYSPLHNVEPGVSYPPTLLTTADHDDRVVPAHSYKFVAELQAKQAGPAPILIRIETKAGHGSGKPTSKQIEEATDKLAFFAEVLGVDWSEETAVAR